jgi:hypothetical protein
VTSTFLNYKRVLFLESNLLCRNSFHKNKCPINIKTIIRVVVAEIIQICFFFFSGTTALDWALASLMGFMIGIYDVGLSAP